MVVATSSVFIPKTAPVKWRSMFSTTPSQFGDLVVVGDVPELSAALEAVRARSQDDQTFARGMNAFADQGGDALRNGSLEWEYLSFVGSIVGRAVATDATSDEDLLNVYLQLERGRFAPELSGDLVAPLTMTDLGIEESVELGGGVTIEALTPDMQRARALDSHAAEGVSPYLVAAATHAVVVKAITISNLPYANRILATSVTPIIPASDVDKIDRAIQCIHIVIEKDTGYNQLFVRPDGWADGWNHDLPPIWKIEAMPNYPQSLYRAPWQTVAREPAGAEQVNEIAAAYRALDTAPNDVKLAARRSVGAMMRTNDEDRTLDATIGVEALLLSDNAELKHRMALRAAAALFDEYRPEAIYELARKVYDHRSEIAHGSVKSKPTFKYDGDELVSAEIAPFLLRALLRSRLASKNPWTKDDLEKRLLTGLDHYRASLTDTVGQAAPPQHT
ncbi:hypothetical protein BN971_03678 [Mycobacterium bohemicum DSM 44277]|nr:hypothetical protein BN971_03678 [Mycobacterium bohemicum DSM 44277]